MESFFLAEPMELGKKMGEGETLMVGCLSVIISLCYCYFIPSKTPKGKLRFISLLPIFYLFTILPLFVSSSTFITGITSFFITWLANFKLLLYAFDKGPLSHGPPTKSLLLFIVIAALPSKTKDDTHGSVPTKPKKVPLNFSAKTLLVAMLIALMDHNRKSRHNFIHPNAVLVLYCFLLYLLLDLVVASATTVVRAVVGLELEVPSDEPYLSTSLQDFWGKRWNLMVTNILRHTVYLPVKSACTGLLGKDTGTLVAVFASFVMSGLMHEVVLYHIARARPTWEFGSFFVLHGVCVVVELVVKRATESGRRLRLPPYFSGPLTVGFVALTGFWLFFPPLINNGLDTKVIGELIIVLEFMKSKLQMIYHLAIRQKQN